MDAKAAEWETTRDGPEQKTVAVSSRHSSEAAHTAPSLGANGARETSVSAPNTPVATTRPLAVAPNSTSLISVAATSAPGTPASKTRPLSTATNPWSEAGERRGTSTNPFDV